MATDHSGASVPGGLPEWFDPSRDALLTPGRLKGLVHPIRVRLMWLLETDGPSTASELARRIGESSGVTSYHLRVLAENAFIEDDAARGTGRDRWWRPRYRSTSLTFRSPDDPGDQESVELAEQYMRMLVETYYGRMVSFVNGLSGRRHELRTLPWTLSEFPIELTYDEARAMANEVVAIVSRYRREPGQTPRDGAVRAIFQFQTLPDEDPVDR
jgi:DNA-binding transcriptional ArsR family regulator